MESARLGDHISFSEEKMKKNALFDSSNLFYDAYCLLPGQAQKVHAHEDSDHAVIARAGEPHGVRNDSGDELVLLVTMAPRPA